MVSSHLKSGKGRHISRIENFLAIYEDDIQISMNVDETAGNDRSGTASNWQEMSVDSASRVQSKIVEVIIRHENGYATVYSWDNMTIRRRHRMLDQLQNFMSTVSEKPGKNENFTRQARRCRKERFGSTGKIGGANGDQSPRVSDSSESSSGDRAQSDTESRIGDLIRINRRKKAKRNFLESASILEEAQPEIFETVLVKNATSLMIADEKAVIAYFRRILADGQQGLCKKLAKWWIRAINPNKQTNYPYAGGSDKKPPWWPLTPPNNAVGIPTKGTSENGLVRHKEPDHLAKPERLTLLPYLLNQITNPRNRTEFNYINVTKLLQISMDSINNETTDKDKHESWRRFVTEIFRVALQQERYKNGEIDETTAVPVMLSYESWRHKSHVGEAEEECKSDGEYDDDESDSGKHLTPESPSDQNSYHRDHLQHHPLGDRIEKDNASYIHDTRLPPSFQSGKMDHQPCYRLIDDLQHEVTNQPSYAAASTPVLGSFQQPTLILEEPFRRHSDTSNRFSSQGSFLSFLPNTNMGHITNPQYQAPQSSPITRPLVDIPQFPVFHDAGLFPRSNASFEAPARELILGSRGNLHQLSQQQQSFQDYLDSQDYGHCTPKMDIMNLSNSTGTEFTYDQKNESSVSRSEFSYDVKSHCSLEPESFNLDEITNGGSMSHREHVR